MFETSEICYVPKKKSFDRHPSCFCYLINLKGYQNMDLSK